MTLILPSFLLACGVILILIHLLPRKLYFPYLLLSVAIILIVTYCLFPAQRIVSNHGLFHSAVIYQMLAGSIPPDNPFLAGTALHYPWVYDLLIAGLMKCFSITPSIAFVTSNVGAWMAICLLVYSISRRLFPDAASNAASTAMALLANTLVGARFNGWIEDHFHVLFELRGVPAVIKFSNINAYPVGLVFFFTVIVALINIASRRHRLLNHFLFGLCLVITGFVYPLLIFNCLASVGAITAVALFCHCRKIDFVELKQILIIGATTIVCCLILKPFYDSVGTGMNFTLFFFSSLSRENVTRKLLGFLVHGLIPLLLIICYRKYLLASLDRRTLLLIGCVAAASASTFFTFHIYDTGEYKFQVTTMVLLGIVAGLAVKPFLQSRLRHLAWFVVPVLLFVPFDNLRAKCAKSAPRFVEAGGRYRVTDDPEENELCRWIRKATAVDSVWVDLELHLPVLAQRKLLFAPNFLGTQGYGFELYEHLTVDHSHARQSLNIARTLYESTDPLDAEQMEHLRQLEVDVFLLARSREKAQRMKTMGHARVFATDSERFAVFQIIRRSQ